MTRERLSFSAIVPNYNDARVIGRALASLLAQTSPFYEILIVDDGSTDESVGVIERLMQRAPALKLIRAPSNEGVVSALNRGLRAASGTFVVLCSANDTYDARLVETCQHILNGHPEVGVVTGNSSVFRDGRQRPRKACIVPLDQQETVLSPASFVTTCRRTPSLMTPGFAINRELAISAGGLDPDLRWHSDWFLFHAVALASGYAFVPSIFSTIYIEQGPRYSSGLFEWRQERAVIRAFLRRLRSEPATRERFKRGALFPRYDLRALASLMARDDRAFITPLLVWRLCTHSSARWSLALLPRPLLTAIRRWMRA